MQYGAPYIGRHFKLTRAHHMDDKRSLTPGSIGSLKAVDEQNAMMLVVFPGTFDGAHDIKAWIPEAIVTLVDEAEVGTSETAHPAPTNKPQGGQLGAAEPKSRKSLNGATYRPHLLEVKSTQIKAIGYFDADGTPWHSDGHAEDGGDVVVEFTNGGIYRYAGVLRGHFDGLREADSVGKYFAANFKKPETHNYKAEKLEG